MDIKYLEAIRMVELETMLAVVPLKANDNEGYKMKVLEIGSGTGIQAKKLSEYGFEVEAIDLKESNYSNYRVWPIKEYDGKKIPFPDHHFDIIFSSSVLEHIPHLEDFQMEMRRVLKKGGKAVHIVPSTQWRFYTSLTHYPNLVKWVVKLIFKRSFLSNKITNGTSVNKQQSLPGKYTTSEILSKALFPERHGETGSSVSELYYFSKYRWSRIFHQSGWNEVKIVPNGVCYSGNALFGGRITLGYRKKIASVLGSVCHIFILSNVNKSD